MPFPDGKMLPLAILFVVGFVVMDLANGACCGTHTACCPLWKGCCGDCTYGTPYCGYGGCNIFGCNCDGGCRSGSGNCIPGCIRSKRRRSASLTAHASPLEMFTGLDINK